MPATETRIRKKPAGYKYKEWPEGDLLAHVQKNYAYYLSCVFSIVRPGTKDCRHDFREWCQVLDWIVQNLFELPPLLDGHREEQERISNPHLNWLRDVAVSVEQAGKLDEGLRPGELVDLCMARGLKVPGCGSHTSDEQQTMAAGRILNKLFADAGADGLMVGGYFVKKDRRQQYDQKRHETLTINYFWFSNATS